MKRVLLGLLPLLVACEQGPWQPPSITKQMLECNAMCGELGVVRFRPVLTQKDTHTLCVCLTLSSYCNQFFTSPPKQSEGSNDTDD